MTTVMENPQIEFSDYATDREFERQFHQMFLYLRISLRKVSKTPRQNMVSNPSMVFTENSTVKDVCDKLYGVYGRTAVIQRYTINTWLDITRSRHWTLRNQNEEARKLSPA
ncbi:MAG: hypothetical protein ACKO6I_07475 [Sphingomonadales bacterium]